MTVIALWGNKEKAWKGDRELAEVESLQFWVGWLVSATLEKWHVSQYGKEVSAVFVALRTSILERIVALPAPDVKGPWGEPLFLVVWYSDEYSIPKVILSFWGYHSVCWRNYTSSFRISGAGHPCGTNVLISLLLLSPTLCECGQPLASFCECDWN